MADDDADLVALIDGEIDEPRRSELLARIKDDPQLRERYEALQATSAPMAAALDLAREGAPVDRLRTLIPPEPAKKARFSVSTLRPLAAGIALGVIVSAAAASFALRGEADWRSAVMDYMDLYTRQTFAFPPPDVETRAQMLAAVGSQVGAPLTPVSTAAPGLDFRVAFILGYEGTPLAEVAYVDPSGEPVLLCVFGKGGADAEMRVERRGEYALANWTHGGRDFLVIGRLPDARVAEVARSLAARL
jgi:anti-sigma factor RsiW